jgi:hypothetical protein
MRQFGVQNGKQPLETGASSCYVMLRNTRLLCANKFNVLRSCYSMTVSTSTILRMRDSIGNDEEPPIRHERVFIRVREPFLDELAA